MDSSSLSRFFEPNFYYFRNGYWSENCPEAEKMEKHLVAKILDNPLDLDSHTRRILLNIHFEKEQELIGALQDLFIALGDKGEPIKRNLLERSKSVIATETFTALSDGLDKSMDFSVKKNIHSYLY